MGYALNIWKNFEHVILSYPELAFGKTKAGLSSLTPKVHPNDKLFARFRKSSVTCAGGFHLIFLVFSYAIEKINRTSVCHVLVLLECGNVLPLWNILDCTMPSCRFRITECPRTALNCGTSSCHSHSYTSQTHVSTASTHA